MAVSEYKNASFEVVAPGMMTTVQDGGRVGFQQYGMPVAGPMDGESYAIGQAPCREYEARRGFGVYRTQPYAKGERYMYCCFHRCRYADLPLIM